MLHFSPFPALFVPVGYLLPAARDASAEAGVEKLVEKRLLTSHNYGIYAYMWLLNPFQSFANSHTSQELSRFIEVLKRFT
jgi:hypothetical protein